MRGGRDQGQAGPGAVLARRPSCWRRPGRCVALEDSPNGVAAAEAAGCRVIAVPNVAPVPERPGRVIVRSLAELNVARLRELVADAAEPGCAGPGAGKVPTQRRRCMCAGPGRQGNPWSPASADAAVAQDFSISRKSSSSSPVAAVAPERAAMACPLRAAGTVPPLPVLLSPLPSPLLPSLDLPSLAGRVRRSIPETTKATSATTVTTTPAHFSGEKMNDVPKSPIATPIFQIISIAPVR